MAIALELGDVRLGNTVMLGAMADHLPFPPGVLLDAILKRFLHASRTWSRSTARPSKPAVPPTRRLTHKEAEPA